MPNPFLDELRRQMLGQDIELPAEYEPDPAKRAARKAISIGPSPWDESHRLEASVPARRPSAAVVAKALENTPKFADLVRSGEITAEQAAKAQALKRAIQASRDAPEVAQVSPKTYPIDPVTGELVFTAEQMAAGRALKRAVQEARDLSPFKFEKMAELMKAAGGKAEELIRSRIK